MRDSDSVDFEYAGGVLRPCPSRQAPAGGGTGAPCDAPARAIMDEYSEEELVSILRRQMAEAAETMRLSAEIKELADAIAADSPGRIRTVSGT